MLSCSTCWNCTRHTKGENMLQEILDRGFEWVELGHGIRLSLMEGIQRYYDAGKVQFSTLHNFCPVPTSIFRPDPNCYEFSDARPAMRAAASICAAAARGSGGASANRRASSDVVCARTSRGISKYAGRGRPLRR